MRTMICELVKNTSGCKEQKTQKYWLKYEGQQLHKAVRDRLLSLFFHLLCRFHAHGWKLLCTFQGAGRERDTRQPSPSPLTVPIGQDSVTHLLLIARKLGNQVSGSRSEAEGEGGWVSPSMLSPQSVCGKLCLEQPEMEMPSECVDEPGPLHSFARPWKHLRLQSLVHDLLQLLQTQTWTIQGGSLVYTGNHLAGCRSPV